MSRFKFGAIVLISLGAIFFSDVGKEGGYFPQDSELFLDTLHRVMVEWLLIFSKFLKSDC